jgi:myo-inositol-1(or 4)-monophosphatase
VTETDQAVENFVRDEIAKKYPLHAFIGEESDAASFLPSQPLSFGPTWVIDPIDGTTNFVHGFPEVCARVSFIPASLRKIDINFSQFSWIVNRQVCISIGFVNNKIPCIG